VTSLDRGDREPNAQRALADTALARNHCDRVHGAICPQLVNCEKEPDTQKRDATQHEIKAARIKNGALCPSL
jgi:hypothetical protein